jgi:hypothetical protein
MSLFVILRQGCLALKLQITMPVEHPSTITKHLNIKTSEKFEIATLNSDSV